MVIRKSSALNLSLGICLVVLSSTATAAEKRLDRSFPVSAGGRLTVNTEGCDITVRGADSNQAVIHVAIYGAESQLERTELSAQAEGNDVKVLVKHRTSDWRNWLWLGPQGGRISIEVPRQYNVNLQTSQGKVDISGLHGDVIGKAAGGDVHAEQIRGAVTLQSSQGNLEGERISGAVEADSSGGQVRLSKIEGKVRAHAAGGDIVTIDVHGDVRLNAAGGNIQAHAIDGAIEAHAAGADVDVQLIGANRGIQVSAAGGDIRIRIPAATGAQIDAAARGGSVRSDLQVAAQEVGKEKLRGLINQGGPLISAQASGGSIHLQAQ